MFCNFLWNRLSRKLHYHKKHLENFKTIKFQAPGLFPAHCFSQPDLEGLAPPIQPTYAPLDQHCFAEASQGLIYVLTKITTCKEAACLPKPFWRLKISAAQMLLKKTLCNSTARVSEGWESKNLARTIKCGTVWPQGGSSKLSCLCVLLIRYGSTGKSTMSRIR